MDKTGNSE